MKNSHIIDQLYSIQNEYLNVLRIAGMRIGTEDFSLILDEITLFWYSKREVIKLILNYIAKDYNCFLFTGASFLDVKDNEHLPFALFGDIRVIDDPLNKYTAFRDEIKNTMFKEKLANEINGTIQDNIEILENMRNEFFILPITQLTDIKNAIIYNNSNHVFWSLFKDKEINLEKYQIEFSTIEQVKAALRTDLIDYIVLSEGESKNIPFEEKFKKFRREDSLFDTNMNDAMFFYYILSGFISQALNTILICSQYNMTPYLRYEVSFKYFMLIGSVFYDNEEIIRMLNRVAIVYICYSNFDKYHLHNVDFDKFIFHIQKHQISKELNEIMNKKNQDEETYKLKSIIDDIMVILKKVYLCVE